MSCCTSQHPARARTCAVGGVRWKVGEAPGRRRASCAQGLAADVRVSIGSRSRSDVQTLGWTLKQHAWRLLLRETPTEAHRTACASGSRPRGGPRAEKASRGRVRKEGERTVGRELCGARRLSRFRGAPRGRRCWARIFCPPAEEKMWVAAPAPPQPRRRFSQPSSDDGDDAASPSGLFLLLRILLVRDSCSSIFGL